VGAAVWMPRSRPWPPPRPATASAGEPAFPSRLPLPSSPDHLERQLSVPARVEDKYLPPLLGVGVHEEQAVGLHDGERRGRRGHGAVVGREEGARGGVDALGRRPRRGDRRRRGGGGRDVRGGRAAARADGGGKGVAADAATAPRPALQAPRAPHARRPPAPPHRLPAPTTPHPALLFSVNRAPCPRPPRTRPASRENQRPCPCT